MNPTEIGESKASPSVSLPLFPWRKKSHLSAQSQSEMSSSTQCRLRAGPSLKSTSTEDFFDAGHFGGIPLREMDLTKRPASSLHPLPPPKQRRHEAARSPSAPQINPDAEPPLPAQSHQQAKKQNDPVHTAISIAEQGRDPRETALSTAPTRWCRVRGLGGWVGRAQVHPELSLTV